MVLHVEQIWHKESFSLKRHNGKDLMLGLCTEWHIFWMENSSECDTNKEIARFIPVYWTSQMHVMAQWMPNENPCITLS